MTLQRTRKASSLIFSFDREASARMTSEFLRCEEGPGAILANHALHLTVTCAPASELRQYAEK